MDKSVFTKNRLAVCIFSGFIFDIIFSIVLHHIILDDYYSSFHEVWRSADDDDAGQSDTLTIASSFFIVSFLAVIFSKGYKGHGIIEGVRFGLYIASLIGSYLLLLYSVIDLPLPLVIVWLSIGYVEYTCLGIIFAVVYKHVKKARKKPKK